MTISYPALGSISSGTMRDEDVIPAMVDALRAFVKANPDHDGADAYDEMIAEGDEWRDMRRDERDADDTDFVRERLDNALNEIAPPYCHFGAHEGDGACFGFWPSISSLEEDARTGDDVLKVDDMSDVPAGWNGYVMLVSDHGNVTLYAPVIEYREVWAVV